MVGTEEWIDLVRVGTGGGAEELIDLARVGTGGGDRGMD